MTTPPRTLSEWAQEMDTRAIELEKVHADTGRPSAVYYKMVEARELAAVLRDAAKTRDERDALREKVQSQFTAAFAKLREELGPHLGSGGGLVEILDGIQQLRSECAVTKLESEAAWAAWRTGQKDYQEQSAELREARAALTGRTVSCGACEAMARERDRTEAALRAFCAKVNEPDFARYGLVVRQGPTDVLRVRDMVTMDMEAFGLWREQPKESAS